MTVQNARQILPTDSKPVGRFYAAGDSSKVYEIPDSHTLIPTYAHTIRDGIGRESRLFTVHSNRIRLLGEPSKDCGNCRSVPTKSILIRYAERRGRVHVSTA